MDSHYSNRDFDLGYSLHEQIDHKASVEDASDVGMAVDDQK